MMKDLNFWDKLENALQKLIIAPLKLKIAALVVLLGTISRLKSANAKNASRK